MLRPMKCEKGNEGGWRSGEGKGLHCRRGQISVFILKFAVESEAAFFPIVGEEGTHMVHLTPARLARKDWTTLSMQRKWPKQIALNCD